MIGYRMVQRFDPSQPDSWKSYIEWSGLRHLSEIVSLDCCLCPPALREFEQEDWQHAVYSEFVTAVFDSAQYAEARVAVGSDRSRLQLLALMREPDELVDLQGFQCLGFDLIEEATAISALTNCQGFEGAFTAADLNRYGLIDELERALQVRARLKELYPDEHHADCAVWALWRRSA